MKMEVTKLPAPGRARAIGCAVTLHERAAGIDPAWRSYQGLALVVAFGFVAVRVWFWRKEVE